MAVPAKPKAAPLQLNFAAPSAEDDVAFSLVSMRELLTRCIETIDLVLARSKR